MLIIVVACYLAVAAMLAIELNQRARVSMRMTHKPAIPGAYGGIQLRGCQSAVSGMLFISDIGLPCDGIAQGVDQLMAVINDFTENL